MLRPLTLAALCCTAAPAALAADTPLTPEAIEAASYQGGPLPEGQSPLAARLQILLDRAGTSPGVIDGWKGEMSATAIRAYERREGLPADGVLDADVWMRLTGRDTGPALKRYRVTEADAAEIVAPLPEDYAELARRDRLGYTALSEALAERFHMDEEFLVNLNAGTRIAPGSEIWVAETGADAGAGGAQVARIVIDKSLRRLTALDANGAILADYPVAIGSDQTPSPDGAYEVTAVAIDPTYSYRPDVNFQQGDNDQPLQLPPGPNGPVGAVWIDLSKPTYGIHGTPEPDELFTAQSHGCVRMTNWDVRELAGMVGQGVSVEFVK